MIQKQGNCMELKIGDLVRYTYPDPMNMTEKVFNGEIENISEGFMIIKNKKNIRLKVSFKNFHQINLIKRATKIKDFPS